MIPKPGYKTTEFAVTVLTAVGALAAALAGQLTPRWAAIAASISTGSYAVSRGLTKLASPPAIAVAPAPAVVPPPQP